MTDRYRFIPTFREALLPDSTLLKMALLAGRDHVLPADPTRALPERPHQSLLMIPTMGQMTGDTKDLIAW